MTGSGLWDNPVRNLMMLWDFLRVDAYRRAIERVAPDRVLVEIGCGHGVLSCLAVRAGARRVYAIEEAGIIETAREVARRNGLDRRVEFIQGNSLNLQLPERADVVFSDLMGGDPLGAGMLVYTHDAARRFLKPGGTLVPAHLELLAVGLESSRTRTETVEANRWLRRADALGERFQLDLSPLVDASREAFSRSYGAFSYKAYVDPAGSPGAAARVLTSQSMVAQFDMVNLAPDRTVRTSLAPLVVTAGLHNAMATYCSVRLDNSTTLTTSPFAAERPSAWGGQFVSALYPVDVTPGMHVEVEAEVTPWTTPAVHYRRPGSPGDHSLFTKA